MKYPDGTIITGFWNKDRRNGLAYMLLPKSTLKQKVIFKDDILIKSLENEESKFSIKAYE